MNAVQRGSAGHTSILLVPGAEHHLEELQPLSDALARRGYDTVVAVAEIDGSGVGPRSYSHDPVAAVLEDLGGFKAVVAVTDRWLPDPLVASAGESGVRTFVRLDGIPVLGHDGSGHLQPFGAVDYVLCQGKNDFDALDGNRFIVGSTRLERLFHAPVMPVTDDHVVINLNFTYGVLEEQRAEWIDTAVAACEQLGVGYTVAIHPAERRSRRIPHTSTVPISRLLLRASTLVSRFSTVPFEAMARGIPFVYHNPHDERVSTFAHGGDAFRTTTTVDELAAAIIEARGWRGDYRNRCSVFFTRQVDIDPEVSAEERAADVIYGLLG